MTEAIAGALHGSIGQIISFSGRSQYSSDGGGVSACGLAALNCIRLILQRDKAGVHGESLLQELAKSEMFEDILSICANWSSTAHLDVDDIYKTPLFSRSLALVWSEYEQPGLQQFQDLLRRLQQAEGRAAAIVITRPPEILSVLKIELFAKPVFVTFDSHPRQSHPDGAAFIVHPSLDAAATYLSDLLKFDPMLLADPALQWQAQLLAHYSAHMFTAKEMSTSQIDLEEALLEASLSVLALQAEASELKARISTLESDNRHLAEENTQLELRVEDLEEDVRRHIRRAVSSQNTGVGVKAADAFGLEKPMNLSSAGPSSSYSPPIPSSSKGKLVLTTSEFEEDDATFATRIQLEWQDQGDSGVKLALERQRQYDEEDRQLRAHFDQLKQSLPSTFQCDICLDDETEFMIAKIDACGHSFCRDCILSYIHSKLQDHRFPIICPSCSAADKGESDPGIVDDLFAQQVGLTEEDYAIFTELQLAAFSVSLTCQKCHKSVFVDREEYDAETNIVCPLPGCNYVWCKSCSRPIEIGGPPHSCDGTSELNHLMTQQGWKHCPGCRTPTSKIEGCNHMTCISPGCNTHFCYVCGETIVQSVRRDEIRRAISNHYAKCRLIDDIWEAPRRRRV